MAKDMRIGRSVRRPGSICHETSAHRGALKESTELWADPTQRQVAVSHIGSRSQLPNTVEGSHLERDRRAERRALIRDGNGP